MSALTQIPVMKMLFAQIHLVVTSVSAMRVTVVMESTSVFPHFSIHMTAINPYQKRKMPKFYGN